MNLLVFVVRKRLRSLTGINKSATQIVMRAFWIMLVVMYGIGLGLISEILFSNASNKKANFSFQEFFLYINLFISILYLISNFFPSYLKAEKLVAKSYPIKPIMSWLLGVVNDGLTLLFVSICLFYVSYWLSSSFFTFSYLLISLSGITTVFFIIRSVKLLIEYKVSYKGVWALLNGLALYVLWYCWTQASISQVNLLLVLLAVVAFATLNFSIDNNIIESTRNQSVLNNFPVLFQHHYFYFLRKNTSRTVLFISFLVKISLLIPTLSKLKTTSSNQELNFFISIVYLSPVLIYSYLFNNSWGYFTALWINLSSRTMAVSAQIRWFLKLITVPLIIDFILTIICLIITNKFQLNFILFYLTTAILLSLAGLWFSFYKPIHITSIISFDRKGNVNFLSVLTSLLTLAFAALPLFFNWAYFLSISIVIAALVVTIQHFKNYHSYLTKYDMYDKLMKRVQ